MVLPQDRSTDKVFMFVLGSALRTWTRRVSAPSCHWMRTRPSTPSSGKSARRVSLPPSRCTPRSRTCAALMRRPAAEPGRATPCRAAHARPEHPPTSPDHSTLTAQRTRAQPTRNTRTTRTTRTTHTTCTPPTQAANPSPLDEDARAACVAKGRKLLLEPGPSSIPPKHASRSTKRALLILGPKCPYR